MTSYLETMEKVRSEAGRKKIHPEMKKIILFPHSKAAKCLFISPANGEERRVLNLFMVWVGFDLLISIYLSTPI